MLMILAALLISQDPEWAATAHAAGRASGVALAPRLTGAQQDSCYEVLERLGAAEGTRDRLSDRVANLSAAIASEVALDRGPEGDPMRRQALVIARAYRDDLQALQDENRRDIHALGSVTLTVCQPVTPSG